MTARAPSERPLVAIFGAGRNGSTLLARLLDGSPDLWLHPIDVVYLTIFDDLAALGRPTGPSLRTATTRPLRQLGARVSRASLLELFRPHVVEIEEEYLPRLASVPPARMDPLAGLDGGRDVSAGEFLPQLIESVRRAYSRRPEPRLLGFKTSETPYIEEYARVFPAMRFVHIVRHPISNYSSAKRTWVEAKRMPFWNGGEDILRTFLEARWLPHARALRRVLEARPEKHVLVRYEDLCADPKRQIVRLCEWLGIRPPAEPDRQTVLGGEAMTALPPNPSKPDVATPERVVRDMAAEFGYEENVTAREAAFIARTAAPLAEGLGYADLPAPMRTLGLWLRWLPPDSSETRNIPSWRRWTVELLRRRLYVTRKLAARREALS